MLNIMLYKYLIGDCMIDENGFRNITNFDCTERRRLVDGGVLDLSITPSSHKKEALVLRLCGYSYPNLSDKFDRSTTTIKEWIDKEIRILKAHRRFYDKESKEVLFSYDDITYESQYEAQLTKLEYVKKLRDIVKSM